MLLENRSTNYRFDASTKLVAGHAIVYSKPTVIAGEFIENIAPGALTETIANDDIRALLNHNSDCVLGRTSAGTLKLREDSVGLHCQLSLADTGLSDYVAKAIERQDLHGWSFGFYVVEESWKDDGYSMPERTILRLELTEVSICGNPAYLDTDIGISDTRGHVSSHMIRKAMRSDLLQRIEHTQH